MTQALEKILIVDDDDSFAELVKNHLFKIETVKEVEILSSGIQFLKQFLTKDYSLVILDYYLNDIDGLQILLEIKEKQVDLPVIMMTGKGDESVVVDSFLNGAIDYIIKDFTNLQILADRVQRSFNKYAQIKQLKIEHQELLKENKSLTATVQSIEERLSLVEVNNNNLKIEIDEIKAKATRTESYYLSLLYALTAIHNDEQSTLEKDHTEHVTILSRSVGQQLGLESEPIKRITAAALFHNIGRGDRFNPELILKEQLSKIEKKEVQTHCEKISAKIADQKGLNDISRFILYHHERWDGTGYPYRLKKEEIPLESRILAVTLSFKTLITHGFEGNKYTPDEAITLISARSGTFFDPNIVKTLEDIYAMIQKK